MKTIRKILLLFLFMGIMGLPLQKTTAQVAVSFQLFYDNLSAYGSWINDPNYGYVWAPNVSSNFAPYRTNGYWVYTEYGWTWVSNYSWGWAPFHYGRWLYDPYYGWLWVPDTQWAPAWVTWRYYDGYYGWAAIGPGISIDVAFSSGYTVPYSQWVFVRERDVCRRNLSNYYVSTSNNTTIIKNSTVINNIQSGNGVRYNAGPGRSHVQKRAGITITQANVRDRDKPGQLVTKNELQLYKPRVERGNASPVKVMSQKDINPTTQRTSEAKANRKIQKENTSREERPMRQREIPVRKAQKNQQTQERQQEMQRNEQPERMETQMRRQEMPQRGNNSKQRGIRQRPNKAILGI